MIYYISSAAERVEYFICVHRLRSNQSFDFKRTDWEALYCSFEHSVLKQIKAVMDSKSINKVLVKSSFDVISR